jgi:hypothetical protein
MALKAAGVWSRTRLQALLPDRACRAEITQLVWSADKYATRKNRPLVAATGYPFSCPRRTCHSRFPVAPSTANTLWDRLPAVQPHTIPLVKAAGVGSLPRSADPQSLAPVAGSSAAS